SDMDRPVHAPSFRDRGKSPFTLSKEPVMSDETSRFDYIVVGSGSAGAIVAARLSEDPDTSVLVLEAGPEDRSYWSRIPLGFAKILFNPRYMWHNHVTDPEPHLNGRSFPLPHGKLVGGSSAINGVV